MVLSKLTLKEPDVKNFHQETDGQVMDRKSEFENHWNITILVFGILEIIFLITKFT
jgi:hypothetical protein